MRYRFVLLASILVFFQHDGIEALDPSRKISEYIHRVYQSEDGLPQNSVVAIEQSREGYLWFGTQEGVVRFDGLKFVTLDHSQFKSKDIFDIVEDHHGNLWIGTLVGLHLVLGESTKVFTTKDGLSDDWIYSLCEDPVGNIWIGTGKGLDQWDGKKFTNITTSNGLPNRYVHATLCEPDGSIWAGTQDGLAVINKGKVNVYTEKDGLPSNAIWFIVRATNGSHWIATENGISHFQNGKFKNYGKKDGLVSNIVNCLLLDQHGALWIGTEEGLNRYYAGKFESFTSRDGLSKDAVWAIHEDDEGNIWAGTGTGGLNQFIDGKFRVLGKREGLTGDYVTSVFQDQQQTLWIGTDEGVNKIEQNKITHYNVQHGLLSEYVNCIYQDTKGNVWIGTKEGLNLLTGETIRGFTKTDGLLENHILALHEDLRGNLWVGTSFGLNRWNGTRFESSPLLPKASIVAIQNSSSGGVWVAAGSSLYLVDFRDNTYSKTRNDYDKFIFSLYQDNDGVLWIGTESAGLARFENGKYHSFTKKDGLSTDGVSAILDDSQSLWLTSNTGIHQVKKAQLDDYISGRIKKIESISYGKGDGMRSIECNSFCQPTVWRAQDRTLWFSTRKGAAFIKPDEIRRNTVPPKVLVEELVVDYDAFPMKHPVNIPPGKNNLEFRYTALSFSAPEKTLFRYRLENFDRNWVEAGTRRVAFYTNLPPGKYKFRVSACNNDGIWNEAGASISLFLKPHFYQTMWFYTICATVVVIAILQVHRYRISRVMEMQRIRMRIATDLHDDIGSGLSKIAILSEVAQQQLPKESLSVQAPLTDIASSSRELVDSMSDIVWAVNPAKDHLTDLVTRMRRFASDFLTAKDIRFKFQVSGISSETKLNPDFRRQVYLIFKESINNIVKHSEASSVDILLSSHARTVFLEIKDNGNGFDSSLIHEGHGLRSMVQRAESLGGKLEFLSSSGNGATVKLTVPTNRHQD